MGRQIEVAIGRVLGAPVAALASVAAIALIAAAGPAAATPPPRDTLLDREAAARGAVTSASGSGSFVSADGQKVMVRWSNPYGPGEAQSIVDFLGALAHGKELGSLRVFLATPGQLEAICGPRALACYSPFELEMVIAGQPGSIDGLSREFLVAHEYGHHVARSRNNHPWSALTWGPKFWASQQEVCRGVRSGRFDPFTGYWNHPGEAFAETFAFLHFPAHTPWQWSFPAPDAGSYAALRRDIRRPWTKNRGWRFTGTLARGEGKDLFRVRTPLDGRLAVTLRTPADADFGLFVLPARRERTLARSDGGGGRERIKFMICGRNSLRIAVRRVSGSGPYVLRVSRP